MQCNPINTIQFNIIKVKGINNKKQNMLKPNIHEISNSTTYSLNPFVDKQLHDKYHNHIDRIIQIVSKQQKQKCKKQVKKVIQTSQTQKRLKQHSRSFKEQVLQQQRKKIDFIMLKHIAQMKSTTKKQMTGDQTALQILKKNKKHKKQYQLTEQEKNMNKKMMSAIMSTSVIDIKKYQKSMQVRVQQYLKLRSHMQKIKTKREHIKTQFHKQQAQNDQYEEVVQNNLMSQKQLINKNKNSQTKDCKENQKKKNIRVRTQSTSNANFSYRLSLGEKVKANLKLKNTQRSVKKMHTQTLINKPENLNKESDRSNINIQIDISAESH